MNLKMKHKSPFQYFKSLCPNTFSNLKNPLCDFCTECKRTLSVHPKDPCLILYRRCRPGSRAVWGVSPTARRSRVPVPAGKKKV